MWDVCKGAQARTPSFGRKTTCLLPVCPCHIKSLSDVEHNVSQEQEEATAAPVGLTINASWARAPELDFKLLNKAMAWFKLFEICLRSEPKHLNVAFCVNDCFISTGVTSFILVKANVSSQVSPVPVCVGVLKTAWYLKLHCPQCRLYVLYMHTHIHTTLYSVASLQIFIWNRHRRILIDPNHPSHLHPHLQPL